MANDDTIYYTAGLPVPETPAEGQPPEPWPQTDLIGQRLPRVDGYARVSGSAVYPSDILLPGMLYGAILRCPHPHALVKKVEIAAAAAMPGVKAILTGQSPEAQGIKWHYQDRQVALFDDHCRFEGEEVAAVAADSWYQAADAIRAIEVDYEVLPFVADHEKSLARDAAKVGDDGNLLDEDGYERGSVAQGFAAADTVLERNYRTSCQLQTPVELHGCVADWDGSRLTLWESSQGVFAVQSTIAAVLGLPLARVRVIGHYVGGGFGSKLQPGKYTAICALLAKKAASPVKLLLTREETFLCVGNRPAVSMRLKAGVTKDGRLTALDFDCTGPSGAYPAGGAQLVDWLVRDLYRCDNIRTKSRDVLINAGPARPFRAPGHPQGAWALEQMIDELAERIAMDPVDLRLRNIPTTSQGRQNNPPYTSTGLRECLTKGAEAFRWRESLAEIREFNRQSGGIKRGAGVAACLWIAGGGEPPATVIVKLFKDGSINLNMGASDIGTGTKTIMALVVAEELGVQPGVVQIEHADTATTQFATPSGGSKTVPTEAPAVRSAAIALKQELIGMAAQDLHVDRRELVYTGEEIVSRREPGTKIKIVEITGLKKRGEVIGVGYRGPNPPGKAVTPFAAQFCELEVNTLTGEIRLRRFLGAHDSGRVMNRLTYDNQVYGGIVMGLGFALCEERWLDERQTGKMCNRNWHDYKLPTALDAPAAMASLPIDPGDRLANNTGAKGLGEPVTIPTAAAIANALRMATGIRFTSAPVTPMEVIRNLSRREE